VSHRKIDPTEIGFDYGGRAGKRNAGLSAGESAPFVRIERVSAPTTDARPGPQARAGSRFALESRTPRATAKRDGASNPSPTGEPVRYRRAPDAGCAGKLIAEEACRKRAKVVQCICRMRRNALPAGKLPGVRHPARASSVGCLSGATSERFQIVRRVIGLRKLVNSALTMACGAAAAGVFGSCGDAGPHSVSCLQRTKKWRPAIRIRTSAIGVS